MVRDRQIITFTTGNVVGNDAIMARLFIGTLKGVAFNWFRSLPANSINSWLDLETRFLSRFYEDDTEVTMDTPFGSPERRRICTGLHREVLEPLSHVPCRRAFAHVASNM